MSGDYHHCTYKLLLIMFFSLMPCVISHAAFNAYNAENAVDYADTWWGTDEYDVNNQNKWKIYNTWHNTDTGSDNIILGQYISPYYNHIMQSLVGGTDCAHFVSQCLIAGGLREEMCSYATNINENNRGWYAQIIFDAGTNLHNPNDGWYADYINGRMGSVHALNSDIWNTFTSTISPAANKYNGQLSMFSYLLNQYHAQYYYNNRPINLVIGDVFIADRHTVLINRHSDPNTTSLVYTAHTRDVRDGDIDQLIDVQDGEDNNNQADGHELCHFFHMVRSVPYVKRVTLMQNTKVVYNAEWEDVLNGTARRINPNTFTTATADDSANINITIEFSQSIKSSQNPVQ